MKNYKILVISILLVASGCRKKENSGVEAITSPGMGNNPSFDVIVTNHRPLLSVFNSKGGIGKRTYSMQLDTSDQFNSKDLIAYTNIPEETAYVTGYRVQEGNELKDGVRYYWRAKATDEAGNSSGWGQTRFYVDTESDKHFMNLVRVPVKDVSVSSGFNEKNNIDLDDPGQLSFWQSTPPGSSTQWVEFGFDKPTTLTRLWMLSNPASKDNRLIDFVWQMSEDKKNWKDIPETRINNNDTFRNIINFPPVKTQYLRLMINRWEGYAAQINAVTFYSPGMPPLPELPNRDYVLVVGNQENGYTFTELQKFIQGLNIGLDAVVVPHYEVSLDMVNKLSRKPVAIVLSGNNANYPNLAMFEYNGEFELIRHSDIPLCGICCGHQMIACASGYTFIRSMGWDDITMLKPLRNIKPYVNIVKESPLFKDIPNPFTAIEVHGWAVAIMPDNFELLAESSYNQAMRSTKKLHIGEQFHAEIKVPYNEATPYLVNFLNMAKEAYKK